MVRGPCVQDLWLLVPGGDATARQRLEILLEGYEQMRDFDRAELALIEPLRSHRAPPGLGDRRPPRRPRGPRRR